MGASTHTKNSYFIKYSPELKRFFGSEKAALIFQKLEYWSSLKPSSFWKFSEPCAHHPQYREGDSWEEETGFSRRVFLRAFALIGTHYKSKSKYLAQSDPFQGKMYASYYDRKTNRTHYLRNHFEVKEFLASFGQGVKNMSKTIKAKVHNGRSGNDHCGRSFTRALDISLQRSTSSQEPDSKSSDSLPPKSEPLPPCPEVKEEVNKNIKIAQDMLKIWNQVTSNRQHLRSDLKANLPQALLDSFQGSMEFWTDFCLKVASSKFLMGEAPNSKFKAYLAWLIKPETIENIKENYYSLGDRVVYDSPPRSERIFNPDEVDGTETWKKVCERLCQRLGYNTFKSWFKGLKFLREDTTHPVLYCPTHFMRDWIKTHYQADLERIVKQILPDTQRIEVSV